MGQVIGAMRVSQVYNLTGSQGTFDFIDVDIKRDTPLFIDPAALAASPDPWAKSCAAAIQHFFQCVLDAIAAGDAGRAMRLLSRLNEDNSTHLGYSSISKGSGIGDGLAEKFFHEISSSQAVQSGLISDLEDTALVIEGVAEDRISDVTTNIIRRQLIEYTQEACRFYGIHMEKGVVVPPYWDTAQSRWSQESFELPVPQGSPLLLVPKFIVRRKLHCDPGEYYTHYVLEYFRDEELRQRSPLVRVTRNGAKVYKKDVESKYRAKHTDGTPGIYKRVNAEGTMSNPDLLARFKTAKRDNPPRVISHEGLAEVSGAAPVPDYASLLADVVRTPKGKASATKYERRVEALLTALFNEHLVHPLRQERLHEGRKILDISYVNASRAGFFQWLSQHHPSANVVVECKNYSKDLGNPEYDQLAGRFSPSRGMYGILAFRDCGDKAKLLKSCRDTARDSRGFITPLDDSDLKMLVDEMLETGTCTDFGGLLHSVFKKLVQ